MTGNLGLDIAIKFFVGIFSSLVFVLLILRWLKPKLAISDKICWKLDEKGNKFYFFKIVNMSIHNAYTVEFELHKKTPYVVDKRKVNHHVEVIKLSREGIYSIPRRHKKIGYGEHAVLVRTFEDLAKDINEDNLEYVLFVSSKHGLSNLTKVATKSFDNSGKIHKGNFKFGSNLDVC
ncbi:MAG: hypothetical protein AAF348_11620 [Bacteroidota bacterium]